MINHCKNACIQCFYHPFAFVYILDWFFTNSTTTVCKRVIFLNICRMRIYLEDWFPSRLNLEFHHRNLLPKKDMLNNNLRNSLRNAMLIEYLNRDTVDKDSFHLNSSFSLDNHRKWESKNFELTKPNRPMWHFLYSNSFDTQCKSIEIVTIGLKYHSTIDFIRCVDNSI